MATCASPHVRRGRTAEQRRRERVFGMLVTGSGLQVMALKTPGAPGDPDVWAHSEDEGERIGAGRTAPSCGGRTGNRCGDGPSGRRCRRHSQLGPRRTASGALRCSRPGRTPGHLADSEFEVEVARRLADAGAPVAELDPRVEPRVYVRDDFAVSLWTYYAPVGPEITPAAYADVLERHHAALRQVDLDAPHFTDRVAAALREVTDRERSPSCPTPTGASSATHSVD